VLRPAFGADFTGSKTQLPNPEMRTLKAYDRKKPTIERSC